MTLSPRAARSALSLAALSIVAVVLLYVLGGAEAAPTLTVGPAVAWLWTGLLGAVGSIWAWRTATDERKRSVWLWLAVGAMLNLLAQLVWTIQSVVLHQQPASLWVSTTGFIAVYPAFLAGVWYILATGPLRRFNPEIVLDTTLLTFTAAGFAFHFLLQPLLAHGLTAGALRSRVAYDVAGLTLIWLTFTLGVRATHLPPKGESLAIIALVAWAFSDTAFGTIGLSSPTIAGGLLDLGWDAANLLLFSAAVIEMTEPKVAPVAEGRPSVIPRLLAVLIGLGGLSWLAVHSIRHGETGPVNGTYLALGAAILAARVGYSLFADRRYEEMLEREVERQTQTLSASLAAAAAAEHNLRLVLEASPDPIVVLDPEGRVTSFNASAPTMVAAPPDQPPGRSVFEFLDPETHQTVREHLAAAVAGEIRRFEIPFKRDDGSRGISGVIYAPVRDRGVVTRVVAIARDITESRRTQSQLQQADKLAAMGQLVSGVAHEINNPAAIISGFAQTLMLDRLSTEQREMIEMIRDEAMRIGQITSNLLAFSRMTTRDRTQVELNEVVRRTHALRAYYLGTLNIQVALQLDASEPKVWGNVSELQQMLLNLIINAEQALASVAASRGITIRTRVSGNEVQLDVADTGPGIESDLRTRIFDPFFTTKPEGVGTGLGLSICYGIVQNHAGRIWVDSELGKGATFSVLLPLDLRTEPRPSPAPTTHAAETGAPVAVLVIDDEPGIRQAAARFLNRCGMQVRAVSEGAEALQVLKTQVFDAILCDVRMPGINGREFLKLLRERHPELVSSVIFTTGDTFDQETADLIEQAGVASLTKPFDFDALENLVRDTAARRSPRGSPSTSGG